MANNCWNFITINGLTKETKKELISWIGTYKDFDCLNEWVESYITKENRIEQASENDFTSYGAKWFDVEIEDFNEEEDDTLILCGDSAWGPMDGLCLVLSKQLQCVIEIEYEECGNDFGGISKYENGIQTEENEMTYWEYRYLSEGFSWLLEEITSFHEEEEGYKEALERLKEGNITLTDEQLNVVRANMGLEPLVKTEA